MGAGTDFAQGSQNKRPGAMPRALACLRQAMHQLLAESLSRGSPWRSVSVGRKVPAVAVAWE